MSRRWGRKSQKVFNELDPRLQRVMERVRDEVADISLTTGHRGRIEQDALFYANPPRSKVQWPNSKHNSYPALAVDFQPYPYPDKRVVLWASLAYVAGAAIRIAKEEGVELRWGGDWNRNGDMTDTKFYDLFHLEIL